MANKYINPVQVDVRQQMPSLQGLNIDTHMPKARSSSQGFVGQALAGMVKDMADYHIQLNQAELDNEFRAAETDFVTKMRDLPPGWANSKEGIDQYDKLVQEKIDARKAAIDRFKGGIPKTSYDEYQSKVAASAAQDLLTAQSKRDELILQEANYKENYMVGNIPNDIVGGLATNAERKKLLGQPTHVFDDDDMKIVHDITRNSINTIKANNNKNDEQKLAGLRTAIEYRDDSVSDFWFKSTLLAEDETHALRIDGVVQRNPTTGAMVMDEKIKSRVVIESLKNQENKFKNGEYEQDLIDTYKISPEQAKEVTKSAYGKFKMKELNYMQQLEARAAAADNKEAERMARIEQDMKDAYNKKYIAMGNALDTTTEIGAAYRVLTDGKMRAGEVFRPLDGKGTTQFEKYFDRKPSELLSQGLVIGDMHGREMISLIKNAENADDLSGIIIDTVVKDLEDEASRNLVINSLAYETNAANIPLNANAIRELSIPLEENKNPEVRNIITSIITSESKPFDPVPNSMQWRTSAQNTRSELKQKFEGAKGSGQGLNILLRHIRVNQERLAQEFPAFNNALGLDAKKGKISESDFELAVISAYRDDKEFKNMINGLVTPIKILAVPTTGRPMSLPPSKVRELQEMAGDQAAQQSAEKSMKYTGQKMQLKKSGEPGRAF